MRIRGLAIGLSAVALLASACNRKAETPPAAAPAAPAPAAAPTPAPAAGFSHEAGFDAAGYYMTQANVKVGTWRLANMGVGAPSDFETWEKGDHSSTFGPILFEFEDQASPAQTGETGAETRSGRIRVLPDSYAIDDQQVSFAGHDAKLGAVSFTGRFDKAALAEAKVNSSSQMAVLTGTLKVGDKTYDRISFTYFVGD
ncbi:hypothetical protein QO010_001719 [Caulobacter ginsengisoli]|uniref:Lipid/polyisoprenoid-binding YceI-like domain-containing protein n=1 Tax=Caulobacter ginsengisoli TaxID=400775 RepID=A0ABU0IS15_9CAUL|nr:hypothetical protein [Caulobacter ginsengisoli]MDQ0463948.1 hypothetical protein [Caulobacter ginsengisoli]